MYIASVNDVYIHDMDLSGKFVLYEGLICYIISWVEIEEVYRMIYVSNNDSKINISDVSLNDIKIINRVYERDEYGEVNITKVPVMDLEQFDIIRTKENSNWCRIVGINKMLNTVLTNSVIPHQYVYALYLVPVDFPLEDPERFEVPQGYMVEKRQ